MKIIQKIKEFFRRIRTKKLNMPQETAIPTKKENINSIDKLSYIKDVEKPELTHEQKIKEILKTIGCDNKSIQEILKISNIDIDNFRKNLYSLNKLNYTNIQLTIIITNNTNLITMQNEELESIISNLITYFKKQEIVKDLIYSNSKIINTTIFDKIPEVEKIFKNYGISLVDNSDLLIENSNVIIMNSDRLEKSLNFIKQYTKTFENFINLIKTEPIVIGINNANLLAEYM